jgi:hypothetical protein
MNLEFRECQPYDLLLCGPPLGFLESVKQILFPYRDPFSGGREQGSLLETQT